MAGKKIVKCGVKRRYGYLYYVDKDGDVCEVKMIRRAYNLKERELARKKRKAKLAKARIRNKKLLVRE